MSTDLDRLIAELLVVRASGFLADHQRRYPRWELPNGELQSLLEQGVGGVILLGGSAPEVLLRTQQLRRWSGQELLLCADVEEGVGQRFEGASWLVPPLALGQLHREDPERAIALAERYGRCTGRDARAIGLNWVLGPVCDVNNNPANPVINVRAWGETPETVSALAAAFTRGVQAEGVLACAKHFPGHGDTSSDSHLELPVITHGRPRLDAVELPPFRAAIAAGVAAVMTAHLMLTALDQERPATLSPAVLSGLLRRELGFDGLIVTDALVMEAIAGHYGAGEAAVLALEAGADLVLMPADAQEALRAISRAVGSGRLSQAQLERSAERRRRALAQANQAPAATPAAAATNASTDPATDPATCPTPERAANPDRALERELVQASLQVLGSPSSPNPCGVNLIRCDNTLAAPFLPLTAPALGLPEARGYRTCLVEARSPSPWSGAPEAPLDLTKLPPGPVLLQLFVRGNPFRGSAGASEPWPQAIRQLRQLQRLAGVVVYGSPYLWQSLQDELTAVPGLAAVYSPGQMPLAQAEALRWLGFAAPGEGSGFTD